VKRLDAILAGAVLGSIAATLLLRAPRLRSVEAPPTVRPAQAAEPPRSKDHMASAASADVALDRRRVRIWLKVASTAFVGVLVPVY
jgi:hypothetical protein